MIWNEIFCCLKFRYTPYFGRHDIKFIVCYIFNLFRVYFRHYKHLDCNTDYNKTTIFWIIYIFIHNFYLGILWNAQFNVMFRHNSFHSNFHKCYLAILFSMKCTIFSIYCTIYSLKIRNVIWMVWNCTIFNIHCYISYFHSFKYTLYNYKYQYKKSE